MTMPYKPRQGPIVLPPAERASFGTVEMLRALCDHCNAMALVIDGDMACCGVRALLPSQEISKRETESDGVRRRPGKREQNRKLLEQDWRCLYCLNKFGTLVRVSSLCYRTLEPVFDHKVPFSYAGDNSERNFAAACQLCNSIKHARVFLTVEDAREVIMAAWRRKKYEVDGVLAADEESP